MVDGSTQTSVRFIGSLPGLVDEFCVAAHTENNSTSILELLQLVVESDGFTCTDKSEVSGPKVQNNVLSLIIGQGNLLEGVIRKACGCLEMRSVALNEHFGNSKS
jgi:hypothetical protein